MMFRLSTQQLVADVLLAVLATSLGSFLVSPIAAQPTPSLFKHVALISANPETDSLRDQLLVAMSEKNFSLVGRQELLSQLADEKGLPGLADESQIARRSAVGTMIRADVLIILRSVSLNNNRYLEVIFAETTTGSRLQHLTYRDDDVDELAPRIVEQAIDLRGRFADGIKQIVAIPPFVSKNLSHDYDEMQSAVSRYLEESLRRYPGIVVIEFDEAKSIQAENALHADGNRRQVPLVVFGKFKVDAKTSDSIELDVTIEKPGGKTNHRATIPLNSLSKWLDEQVTKKIISGIDTTVDQLTASQQAERFAVLAGTFSSVGDLKRSTSLREALLILTPGNSTQRKELVREYLLHADKQWGMPQYIRHMEFLLRNGQIQDRAEFRKLIFGNYHSHQVPDAIRHEHVRFLAVAARQWNHLPDGTVGKAVIERLQYAKTHHWENTWWTFACQTMLDHFEHNHSGEFLSLHADFVEQYPADRIPIDGLFIRSARSKVMRSVPQQEWNAYFDRLTGSENVNVRMAGELSRVNYLLTKARAIDTRIYEGPSHRIQEPGTIVKLSGSEEKTLHASLEKCMSLLTQIKQLEKTDNSTPWEGAALYFRRKRYVEWLQLVEQIFSGASRYFPEEKYIQKLPNMRRPFVYNSTSPRPRIRRAPVRNPGRLSFEKIGLQINGDLPTLDRLPAYPGFRDIVRCGTFDVLWTGNYLFLMKQPGVLEPVPIPGWGGSLFDAANVSWDGRFVWIAGAQTHRVFVIDSHTWRLHEIEDLPGNGRATEADHVGARCVGPGRAIVAGSFGKHHRAWCAMVTIDVSDSGDELATRIEVFHTARKVPNFDDPDSVNVFDPELAFSPNWFTFIESADGQRRLAISRHTRMFGRVQTATQYPLLIDPDSQQVTVSRRPLWGTRDNGIFSGKGNLFIATTLGTELFTANMPENAEPRMITEAAGRRLVEHDGWLYVCGLGWDRIHLDTLKVETLHRSLLPEEYDGLRWCGVSAHYGLVAFGEARPNPSSDFQISDADAVPELFRLKISGADILVDPNDM